MKILIIKRDKIGDMLLATPLFDNIKYFLPSAQLHLLTSDYASWIVDNNPNIDKILKYSKSKIDGKVQWLSIIKHILQLLSLRFKNFDFIIVANGFTSRRAIKKARLIKGKRIVSFCDSNCKGISDIVPPAPISRHEADRMLLLLHPLGITDNMIKSRNCMNPVYFPPDNGSSTDIMIDSDYIVIGFGARHTRRKPSVEQVLDIAKFVYEQYGFHTIMTWTPGKSDNDAYPGDDDLVAPILQDLPGYIHPLQKTTIQQVASIIWEAKTSMFPDSGLMHFASTSPGGVIALFAASTEAVSPDSWGPRGDRSQVIYDDEKISKLDSSVFFKAISHQLNNNS